MLEKKLSKTLDNAAKKTKLHRSAPVSDAFGAHLQLELRASEERDCQGYSRHPQKDAETNAWESEATWPKE
jgi:hypothetical protein